MTQETHLGLRHGQDKVTVVAEHLAPWGTSGPKIIEQMTPHRARAVAEDMIRRADQLDPAGVVTTVYHLTAEEVGDLSDALSWAAGEAREIRVVFDGGLKVDVGDGGGWSLPYGKER